MECSKIPAQVQYIQVYNTDRRRRRTGGLGLFLSVENEADGALIKTGERGEGGVPPSSTRN
jgi:hypothetical protein